MSPRCDVAVIGAGPAGSVAAGFLVRAGFRVEVFEKETFPRFHIGESLIPRAVPVLLELGLDLEGLPFALKKEGALFASEVTQREFRFDFSHALPNCFPHAYQVERALFDQALAEHSARLGATFHFGHSVSKWEERPDRVTVFGSWGQTDCRYLVDASGQQTLMSKAQGSKELIRGLGKSGTFTHFRNVSSPAARKVFRRGDIIIFLTKNQSWGWAIPLTGDRLSLGIVTKDGEAVVAAEDAIRGYLRASPLLQSILEGATQSAPLRRIANYGHYNRAPSAPRVTSLGDARGFLDPIFSSGITLAVFTAQELARRIAPTVADDLPFDLESYHVEMQRGYQTFERIIDRFYRPGWAHRTFFMEDKPDDMVRQMTTILAGDVWRHDNPFQNKLLANQRTSVWFEEAPEAEAEFSEANTRTALPGNGLSSKNSSGPNADVNGTALWKAL